MKDWKFGHSGNRFYFNDNGKSTVKRHSVRKWDKVYSHYPLMHKALNIFNDRSGYVKDNEPEKHASVMSYPSLWKSHRFGHSQRLYYEADFYPAGFAIEFFYSESREIGRSNGGRYDSPKEKLMTYYERLEMKRAFSILSEILLSEGAIFRPDQAKDKLKGFDLIDWRINKDPARHWGYGESYHDEDYHKNSNARDREKNLIKNGELKYYRNYFDGVLRCGIVYHNINNMWWVLLPSGEIRNEACFSLFDVTSEDLQNRRLARDRSTEEQKARRKIGTSLYNDLIAKGVKVSL